MKTSTQNTIASVLNAAMQDNRFVSVMYKDDDGDNTKRVVGWVADVVGGKVEHLPVPFDENIGNYYSVFIGEMLEVGGKNCTVVSTGKYHCEVEEVKTGNTYDIAGYSYKGKVFRLHKSVLYVVMECSSTKNSVVIPVEDIRHVATNGVRIYAE